MEVDLQYAVVSSDEIFNFSTSSPWTSPLSLLEYVHLESIVDTDRARLTLHYIVERTLSEGFSNRCRSSPFWNVLDWAVVVRLGFRKLLVEQWDFGPCMKVAGDV